MRDWREFASLATRKERIVAAGNRRPLYDGGNMCCHSKCREWHAPGHQARATVGQTALLKAERARQNRAYVRKLLQERQPEFAAALVAAKEQVVRQRGAPDVNACHQAEKPCPRRSRAQIR